MIDTSGADVYGAFSKHLNLGKKQANTHGGEYWTWCPFCKAGIDRFHVWPYRFDGSPQYWCRVCHRSGDVIDFLEQVEGLTFVESCEGLNITLEHGRSQFLPQQKYSPNDDNPPADAWQDKAAVFAHECKDNLWDDIGINALNWLRKRGLEDETIKRAGLGYNSVAKRFESKDDWGIPHADCKAVWLPRGIVIPWQIDRQLWKLNIRRPDVDLGDGRGKYISVKGSSAGIYGMDQFNPERPNILVEGEFDRLILAQVDPDCTNPLATGSTGHAQGERWALTLAQAPSTLVAFDPDAGGQAAARDYWLKALPNSLLWKPWAHDVNDMFLQGLDVAQWLFMGFDTADALLAEPEEVVL